MDPQAPLPPPPASALPQPPPSSYPAPLGGPPARTVAAPLAWSLTNGWRTAMLVAWIGVVLGLGAVWYTSRTLGLSTWWLGPETAPRLFLVSVVPFVLPVAATVLIIRNRQFLPFAGLLAAAGTAAVGAGDITRIPGLAAIEIALAIAGALVSVASLAGMYRPAA
jgi:hypothetical protein